MTSPTIYAAVSRPDTPFATVIDAASRASGVASPLPWMPTHAYVVVAAGGLAWRFDAEIPRARWMPYTPEDAGVHCLWRITDAEKTAAAIKRARAAGTPWYDPGEIAVAAGEIMTTILEVPFRVPALDNVRNAMICTKLTAHVLGWDLQDLLPVRIAQRAVRMEATGETVRAVLE